MHSLGVSKIELGIVLQCNCAQKTQMLRYFVSGEEGKKALCHNGFLFNYCNGFLAFSITECWPCEGFGYLVKQFWQGREILTTNKMRPNGLTINQWLFSPSFTFQHIFYQGHSIDEREATFRPTVKPFLQLFRMLLYRRGKLNSRITETPTDDVVLIFGRFALELFQQQMKQESVRDPSLPPSSSFSRLLLTGNSSSHNSNSNSSSNSNGNSNRNSNGGGCDGQPVVRARRISAKPMSSKFCPKLKLLCPNFARWSWTIFNDFCHLWGFVRECRFFKSPFIWKQPSEKYHVLRFCRNVN